MFVALALTASFPGKASAVTQSWVRDSRPFGHAALPVARLSLTKVGIVFDE